MKLLVADGQRQAREAAARGEKVAIWGPSPGFRELRWIRPVLAGDTISFASEVESLRSSSSRPEWGILEGRNTGINQRGELGILGAGDGLCAATKWRPMTKQTEPIAR